MGRTGGVLQLRTRNLPTNGALNGSQVLLNLIAGQTSPGRQRFGGAYDHGNRKGSAPTITTMRMDSRGVRRWIRTISSEASAASPTGVASQRLRLPSPSQFGGIPRVVCNVDNNADSSGTSVSPATLSYITVKRFTATLLRCNHCGSGAGNITNVVHCELGADFA